VPDKRSQQMAAAADVELNMSIQQTISTPLSPCALGGREPDSAMHSCYLSGDGIAMRRLRSQLQRIAPYFRVALITGEAGTGKESSARELHARSTGAGGPFLVCRAEAFAECLATPSRSAALLQATHRGTLFLEDLDEISPIQQCRLLHHLQQQAALGSQRCDLRIIGASGRELRTLAATGQFREELYRRIAAVEIILTPLRNRPEDIAELAEYLLQRTPGAGAMSSEAKVLLERYSWPGNIRELRDTLQQAMMLAEGGPLETWHLPSLAPLEKTPEHSPRLERLQDVVQRHVLEVLTRCSGNKLRASEALGISRSTLYRMLDACATGGDPGFGG
jgi:DNA-binding NtrC family response regulator